MSSFNKQQYPSIPLTQKDIIQELTSLPSLLGDAAGSSSSSKRRQLLTSLLATSQRLDRSSKQGLIFIVGSTGTGKSSTIRHLFNLSKQTFEELEQANDNESGTLEVQEYLLKCPSDKFETSDITLGIVDTPGFQDTKGMKQDACNMHAIQRFLNEHPNLQGKRPNLVLICFDATDVRFDGTCGSFNKAMQCIRKLQLVDSGHPNVVAIITKCCSMRPDFVRKYEQWQNKIDALKMKVKEIVESHLHIDVPVVIMDNHYEEEELKRPQLPDGGESDFTELPNGELQPYNLFKACSDTYHKQNDLFGYICFETIFLEGHSLETLRGFRVESKDVMMDQELNSDESHLLKFLENINSNENVYFIKKKAQEFISERKLTECDSRSIKQIVRELCKFNYFDEQDMKLINCNVIAYLLGREVTNLEREFLTTILKVPDSVYVDDVIIDLQSGFNIFTDSFSNQPIFDSPQTIRFGVRLPTNCSCKVIHDTGRQIFEVGENRAELIEKRINFFRDVNVQVDDSKFKFTTRPGFLLVSEVENTSSANKEYFEERKLKLDFDYEKANLSSGFTEAVNNLPSYYTQNNASQFQSFFKEFGYHFVKSAYCGGSYVRSSISNVEWNGGNSLFKGRAFNIENRKKWSLSIMSNPIVLTTEMSLESISTAVAMMDKDKAEAVLTAMSVDLIDDRGNVKKRNGEEQQSSLMDEHLGDNSFHQVQPLTRKEAVQQYDKIFYSAAAILLLIVGGGLLWYCGPVGTLTALLAGIKSIMRK